MELIRLIGWLLRQTFEAILFLVLAAVLGVLFWWAVIASL